MARQGSNAQGALAFGRGWGGRRKGAGRPPNGEAAGVSHGGRARLAARHPMHVTARLVRGLPSLRRARTFRVLRRCFLRGCDRRGFRLVHFSVQSNHLHLICEAVSQERMIRGLQGLFVRVAKALNKLWARRGSVFADRYHDHILRTPTEVRNALLYVLNNARKHGCAIAGVLDAFASGWWFDGWAEEISIRGLEDEPPPVCRPRTWLLRTGWRRGRRGAAIPVAAVPGAPATSR